MELTVFLASGDSDLRFCARCAVAAGTDTAAGNGRERSSTAVLPQWFGLWARTTLRSPTVGRWVTSIKPTLWAMSASSPMDQHFPGVECMSNTEYSAMGRGPRLSRLMWVS